MGASVAWAGADAGRIDGATFDAGLVARQGAAPPFLWRGPDGDPAQGLVAPRDRNGRRPAFGAWLDSLPDRARLDEDLWGPLRRRHQQMRRALTRRFPPEGYRDFVAIHATYLHPALTRAEVLAWGTAFDRKLGDVRRRLRHRLDSRSLRFRVSVLSHRPLHSRRRLGLVLAAARLEVDGRFFRPAAFTDRELDQLLTGGKGTLVFRPPEDELELPGPSAHRIRLWFDGLPTRRRQPARIRFPKQMFDDRWEHRVRFTRPG